MNVYRRVGAPRIKCQWWYKKKFLSIPLFNEVHNLGKFEFAKMKLLHGKPAYLSKNYSSVYVELVNGSVMYRFLEIGIIGGNAIYGSCYSEIDFLTAFSSLTRVRNKLYISDNLLNTFCIVEDNKIVCMFRLGNLLLDSRLESYVEDDSSIGIVIRDMNLVSYYIDISKKDWSVKLELK